MPTETKPSKQELDAQQGKQIMEQPALNLPEIQKLASGHVSPESPIAQIMATLMNPNSANLNTLAAMFSNYVDIMPLPPYVKEAAKNFVASLKRWSDEQAGVIDVKPESVEVVNGK